MTDKLLYVGLQVSVVSKLELQNKGKYLALHPSKTPLFHFMIHT